MSHVTNDSLAAFADGHVLHRDLLLASGSIALECFDLGSKRSHELIERTLSTVLLQNIFNMREAARKCHGCHVYGSHLACKHRLNLVSGLNTLDNRKHEVDTVLVGVSTAGGGVGHFGNEATIKI